MMSVGHITTETAARIGPLRVERASFAQARDRIVAALEGGTPLLVAFCNAHTAQLAFADPSFARLLEDMLVLNDGIGIELAARALEGRGFPANLNGTDFVPALLAAIHRPLRIYLLGARPAVVARAAEILARRHSAHRIVGFRDGYFDDAALPAIAGEIAAARADLLLCAMGDGRQQRVMAALGPQAGLRVLMGVGALFDFLSQAVPRAPLPVRRMRMEFLWRLAREPRRLGRRYTVELVRFLLAVARLRFAR